MWPFPPCRMPLGPASIFSLCALLLAVSLRFYISPRQREVSIFDEVQQFWETNHLGNQITSIKEAIGDAPQQVLKMKANITVSKDGTGNFTTIREAVDAAPDQSKNYYRIDIKAGVYKENVEVGRRKTRIAFVGDGVGRTIISSDRSAIIERNAQNTAAVRVKGDGFVAAKISFENTALPGTGYGVAVSSEADPCAFYRCSFYGHKGTVNAKRGRQLYKKVDIYGAHDVIFGGAAGLFRNFTVLLLEPLPGQPNTISTHESDKEKSLLKRKGSFIFHGMKVSFAESRRSIDSPNKA